MCLGIPGQVVRMLDGYNDQVALVDVQRAHLRIIEALADGDDSLARYRTRRHLDATASWWL